jgi:hypothetical protein
MAISAGKVHIELPKHLGVTQRQWKTRKRREIRAVVRALETFQRGSAFTPAYNDYREAMELVRAIADACSEKKWGR